MEASGAGIGRLDCYEDMFKEITRKLYGDDPDHRTSSVQNEFETSVSYKNSEDDTEHGTDGSDDGNWTCEEEPLKGTDGSRIAAYHAAKSTWRCYECGECMGGGPRDAAEHFIELHSSRIIGDDLRTRHQQHNSPRKDYMQNDLKVEEVVSYLERVRDRAERGAPPSRRTQETQTVPAALLPVTTTFLIQELPTVSPTAHLHQQNATTMVAGSATTTTTTTVATSSLTTGSSSASGKRYTCPHCPYGTDRRDLYTRHENIHREEKPFHCYICFKPFNRADHVKKHFLRMHREHGYELSKIRRTASSNGTGSGTVLGNAATSGASTTTPKTLQNDGTNVAGQTTNGATVQHANYPTFNNNKTYHIQTGQTSNGGGAASAVTAASAAGTIYQASTLPSVQGIVTGDVSCPSGNRRIQNGGCNSKSHVKGAGTKAAQERRYTCCYCSWSGVDNWCLKRHLNTHLKPFACALCEYKAARAERLATHVLKVHNKRQCSRCSFLGEDAAQLQVHQLHVHRVSSASAPLPTASTNQQTQNPNNRHQQTVHPSGGGRPPPGPPVFPASTPAITPATSVIPSTTILGKIGLGEDRMALRYEDWFMRALRPSNERCHVTMMSGDRAAEGGAASRRSRKQSTPRKVVIEKQDENDEEIAVATSRASNNNWSVNVNETSMREQSDRITKDFLKCYQCPDNAPARGSSSKPYHTKASLVLHTLWRHRRFRKTPEALTNSRRDNASFHDPPRSSITLKATVITTSSSNYRYQR